MQSGLPPDSTATALSLNWVEAVCTRKCPTLVPDPVDCSPNPFGAGRLFGRLARYVQDVT